MNAKKFLSILLSIAMIASMAVVSMAAATTLPEAVNGVIKLTEDVVLSKIVIITDKVTIDLAGHSITAVEGWDKDDKFTTTAGTEKTQDALIVVSDGGDLTIMDSVGGGSMSSNGQAECYAPVKVVPYNYGAAKLTIEGGKLEGYYYGICCNGNPESGDVEITVKDGEIVGTNGCGIYFPCQEGVLNIDGGHIEGDTGVEIRAGELNMTAGTVIGTGSPVSIKPNGSGATSDGVGIAVSQHTTKKDISINVSGGSVEGYSALYVSDPENNNTANVELDITAGEFVANASAPAVVVDDSINTEIDTKFISGGSFSSDPTDYLAEDLAKSENSNGTFGVVALPEDSTGGTGSVIFEITPMGTQLEIDGILQDDTSIMTLPTGTHTYRIYRDGFGEVSGEFTVVADSEVIVSQSLAPTGAGGYGIYLEGPYIYKSDEDVMLNEAEVRAANDAFEYGEPVYYLIFDETVNTPLSDHDFVEKLKAKATWSMGGSAVEAVNVAKKYINMDEVNACTDLLKEYGLDSGYYYFLEIVTAEKKGIAETDVVGVVEFDRKADSKNGVEKIKDCKIDVDFTLFYPNTWLNDGTISDDRADLEWDTPYVLKFDYDDEVELSFGSASGGNNEGTFTVDVSGQGKIYLEYITDADEAIAAANEGAKMDFLTFKSINGVGVKFNRTGEFRYEMDDAAYAYEVVDGKLAPIAGLEVEDDEFIFNTNILKAYVFSDTELVQPA